MGTVRINDDVYEDVTTVNFNGNRTIIINGKDVSGSYKTFPQINVTIEGDVKIGVVDVNTLTVNGSLTTGKNVDCNDITVYGDMTVNGDVDCNTLRVEKDLTCGDVDANTVKAGKMNK